MTGAAGVTASTALFQRAGPGSTPRAALHDLQVRPIPSLVARKLIVRHHYLHSLPGGTHLAFGVFLHHSLSGTITLGAGPYNAHSLVNDASPTDCLTLTSYWLNDALPSNSESHVLGVVLRFLTRHTTVKFLVTYADPAQGHSGTIYQATNWLYTGLSEPTPLYDVGDGKLAHCRTFATTFGTRSVRYLTNHGVEVRLLPESPKHRYVYFLDRAWEQRLKMPGLPYPKQGTSA